MSGSPEVVDYGRFADRLAAARAAAAADPARRWDLYHEFHAEWGSVAVESEPKTHEPYILDLIGTKAPGDPEADPEADPGIPEALAEWWILPAGADYDHGDWPPTWRPDPTGYGVSEGLAEESPFAIPGKDLRMACFLAEAQYCNEWAYLSAESHLPDPKVLVSVGPEWEEQAPSVSQFFLHLATRSLLPEYAWTAEPDDWDETDGLAERVRAVLPELGLRPWRELGSWSVLHGGPDVIVDVDVDGAGNTDYPLRVFGRTREAVENLLERLGGEWQVAEPEQTAERDR